jgi:hypothetical protein
LLRGHLQLRVVELGVELIDLRDQLVDALGHVLAALVRFEQLFVESANAA